MTTCDYRVTLEPIDPWLFGDSRSARAGMDHLQEDQDPTPLTFQGAIGMDIVQRSGSGAWPTGILGPQLADVMAPGLSTAAMLSLRCVSFLDADNQAWFPRPLHARVVHSRDGSLWPHELLAPDRSGSCRSSIEPLSLLAAAPPVGFEEEDGSLLVDEALLGDILCGEWPSEDNEGGLLGRAKRLNEVYRREPRPGIAIENDSGRVGEGLLFTRPYRRFASPAGGLSESALGWGIAAWISCPGPVPATERATTAFLGGDRRRARVRYTSLGTEPLAKLRDRVIAAATGPNRGFVCYFVTPRIITGSVAVVSDQRAVASACGKPQWSSGWNTAGNHPRPLIALQPAGAVDFFEWPPNSSPTSRRALIEQQWLGSSGPGQEVGFGRHLVGVWK
jgi:hypothetical protein